jgi:hypothetical protein
MTTIMVPDLVEPTDEIRLLCDAVVTDLHEVRRAIASVGVPAGGVEPTDTAPSHRRAGVSG